MGYDGTLKFDTKVDSSGFESGVSKIGSLASGAIKATTAIIGGATTALVGMGTAAVKVGSEFEASMSNVAAISGATGDELDALTAKAQEMGSKTKFSASESADAFSYMAMAGWKTGDMLNGIEGIMNLAAASGEDLATTSDIVTDALTAFGLSAQDSGHFADILAAASSNANTNVGLMGETFKYVAPVAGALGFSAEDTAQAIGLMANAGIKGSQAGTALRSTFTRLAKPTKEVQTALDALNISLTDEQGNVKSLSTLMGDLREGFANCTDAEAAQYAAMIAGQEGMSGLLAIVNASEEDYNKLAGAIAGSTDELTGYSAAEEMAAKQIDNLQGQVTILKSALEGFGIKIYQEMDSPLKEVVKTAQDMVQQLTDAFDEGGFEGLVSAIGDVLAQIITKVADAAPQFIDMAVSLVHSFCEGLTNAPDIGKSGAKLVASLVNGILSVMGDLATTAITLITELVLGLEEHLPDILQTGIDVVLNVIDGLTQALPKLLPAAVRIIGTIAKKIVENLPAIIDAAIEIIMAVIDGLMQAMPELLSAAVEVYSALIKAIPIILDKLLAALPDIITGIIDFLVENIPAVLEAGTQLLMALVDAIPEIIPVLLDNLPSIIEAIVGGLLKAVPTILAAILEAAVSIAGALPRLLFGIIEALGEWFGSILEDLGTFLLDVWQDIADWFGELPGKIATFFDGLISDIGEFFSNVISDAGTFLSNLMKDIGAFLKDLPYKIGYALGEAIGKIIQWGKDVFNWIKENVPKMIENVVNFFAELPGKIWNWLKETYNKVVQWGKDTWQSAKQAAKDTIDAVISFFKELPGKVWNWLTDTIQKIVSFGVDLVNKGKAAASDFLNGFVNIVKSLPEKMYNIGRDIVNGVWNGIKSLASTLWNNVSSFFSGIVDGVKRTLGIASPSKVFAKEVGAWIPPGVGEGIKKEMPDLLKDTQTYMRKLSDSLQTEDLDVKLDWSMDDVRTAMRMAVGIDAPDKRYDLDGDGTVTSSDARTIQRAVAGLKDTVIEMTKAAEEQAKWSMEDVRQAMRMSVGLEKADSKYDVDGDGGVTSADARLIQRSFAGIEDEVAEMVETASEQIRWSMADVREAMRMSVGLDDEDLKFDVDKDGKVTSADARLIQRSIAGLDSTISGSTGITKAQISEIAATMQDAVRTETKDISYTKTGQQEYEQAQADRRSRNDVNVKGQFESDRPIEIHTNLYLDKRKFAEEITPAVNHEMYKIDSNENNRGRGN